MDDASRDMWLMPSFPNKPFYAFYQASTHTNTLHTHTHVFANAPRMCAHIFTRKHDILRTGNTYTDTHIYTHMHTHMHAQRPTERHTYMYTYMHIHVGVHMVHKHAQPALCTYKQYIHACENLTHAAQSQ